MTTLRAAVLCLVLGITGCAGAGFNTVEFQAEVAGGRFDQALQRLDSFSDNDVSALLDRGLLLHFQGNYEESNAVFEGAERLIEDLYTRSLTKEALALLTSDRALDYRAAGFEVAYIAYYRAWNYLELGWVEDVLVEARRINERLTLRSASCEDQEGACGHDVFLRYFSGLLFEWGGELNDAYVAYKLADLAGGTGRSRYGLPAPPDLGKRLVRLAGRLGFSDEEALFAERYDTEPGSALSPSSTVVLFWENGIVGRRTNVSAFIPIMKGETEKIRGDGEDWNRRLADRRGRSYQKQELEYLLRISLPRYADPPPVPTQAEFMLGNSSRATSPAAPLSAMARDALDDAMDGILVRAVSRAVIKYLATQAGEERGEGLGKLLNLLGVIVENADTRSWRSLPGEIQVAVVPAEPGIYEGSLSVQRQDGTHSTERRFPGIQVPEGGIVFLRHRSSR